jgi:hypothetical protein
MHCTAGPGRQGGRGCHVPRHYPGPQSMPATSAASEAAVRELRVPGGLLLRPALHQGGATVPRQHPAHRRLLPVHNLRHQLLRFQPDRAGGQRLGGQRQHAGRDAAFLARAVPNVGYNPALHLANSSVQASANSSLEFVCVGGASDGLACDCLPPSMPGAAAGRRRRRDGVRARRVVPGNLRGRGDVWPSLSRYF